MITNPPPNESTLTSTASRYTIHREACSATGPLEARRAIGLKAIRRQRVRLEELRDSGVVGADSFLVLQEELDFEEVSISREDERQIEES